MSALSYQVPEPLVETRVRVYVDGLDAPRHQLRSPPVCEGRSILLEGTPWQQCAYSTPNRTLIPRQTEHGFHSKPSVDSTANRAGIPRLPERDFHA